MGVAPTDPAETLEPRQFSIDREPHQVIPAFASTGPNGRRAATVVESDPRYTHAHDQPGQAGVSDDEIASTAEYEELADVSTVSPCQRFCHLVFRPDLHEVPRPAAQAEGRQWSKGNVSLGLHDCEFLGLLVGVSTTGYGWPRAEQLRCLPV
jgi:hypothetical protein